MAHSSAHSATAQTSTGCAELRSRASYRFAVTLRGDTVTERRPNQAYRWQEGDGIVQPMCQSDQQEEPERANETHPMQ